VYFKVYRSVYLIVIWLVTENASEFDWDEYLKKTNSEALPSHLLGIKRQLPFGVGEMVEVVDKVSGQVAFIFNHSFHHVI